MTILDTTVAVIGAGMSGLACARVLADAAVPVLVLEAEARVGGRLGTVAGGDDGAQYCTARSAPFQQQVRAWEQQGIVAEWRPRLGRLREGTFLEDDLGQRRLVGVPLMAAMTVAMARGLAVRTGCPVIRLEADGHGWTLTEAEGTVVRAWHVVLAGPPGGWQTLVPAAAPLARAVATGGVTVAPGAAVGLAFSRPLEVPFDAAWVEDPALAWIARSSSRPGRPPEPDSWMLHAGPDFTRLVLGQATWEQRPLLVGSLQDALRRAAGLTGLPALVGSPVVTMWAEGLPVTAWPESFVTGGDGTWACGDWCGEGGRVEGAWLSGHRLGQHLAGVLAGPSVP